MNNEARQHLAQAEALIQLNRHGAAVGHLYRAAALEPAASWLHCRLAEALVVLERPREALAAAERATSLAPDEPWAHRLRAIALLRLHRPKAAVQAAEESVRLAPYDSSGFVVLTEARLARNDLTGAAKAARQAVRLDPHRAVSHNAVGVWALKAKDYEEAENACRRALAIDPLDATAMNNLGAAHAARFQFIKALRIYSAALQLDPADDLPLRNMKNVVRIVVVLGFVLALFVVAKVMEVVEGIVGPGPAGEAAALVVMTGALGGLYYGRTVLRRLLPRPAQWAVREVLSLRGVRRPAPLTAEGFWFAWLRLAIALLFMAGGISVLADPTGKTGAGLLITAVAATSAGLTARRLVRHWRGPGRR